MLEKYIHKNYKNIQKKCKLIFEGSFQTHEIDGQFHKVPGDKKWPFGDVDLPGHLGRRFVELRRHEPPDVDEALEHLTWQLAET